MSRSSNISEAIKALEELVNGDKSVSITALYGALTHLHEMLLVSVEALEVPTIWTILESVFAIEGMNFSYPCMSLLSMIYLRALELAPSYLLRSTVGGLLSITTSKLSSIARECAVYVVGKISVVHGCNLGNVGVTDCITSLAKVIKSYDLSVRNLPADLAMRCTTYKSLASIVKYTSASAAPLHADLVKLAAKYITDKAPDVRKATALLIENIAEASGGMKSVSFESILTITQKGFLDEENDVVLAFSKAAGKCLAVQVAAYKEEEESIRADLARGGSNGPPSTDVKDDKKQSITMSMSAKFKEVVSMKKKLVEKYDFQSLMNYQIDQLLKSSGAVRVANTHTLNYFFRDILPLLEQNEFEWLVLAIPGILHSEVATAMRNEESILFRGELSLILRCGIFSNINETLQLKCIAHLINHVSNKNSDLYDAELIFLLNEIAHLLYVIGEASASLVEFIVPSAFALLRSINFDVRVSAVYLLLSISSVVPVVAAGYFRDALTNAKTQASLLLTNEEITFDEKDENQTIRRKASKENERQQRMFLFHGNILLVSMMMKNLTEFPTGIPFDLIIDALEFGLSLLANDVTLVPALLRPVSCSIMRAGSLVVSSALSVGYEIAQSRIPSILSTVKFLMTIGDKPTLSQQDCMPELMCIESTLVIVASLLWFCPEALRVSDHCLTTLVDSLELIFKLLKDKYQTKYKAQFRFQMIHTMLLECFTFLPVGSYPSSSAMLFKEAMRTFRDCIESLQETSLLQQYITPDHKIVRLPINGKTKNWIHSNDPESFASLLFDLGNIFLPFQRRETEAFLASFQQKSLLNTNLMSHSTHEVSSETHVPQSPVILLEQRTIDATISLIAAIFPFQEPAFQMKGIELPTKFIKKDYIKQGSSVSMFYSDEEKKKKDRKSYLVTRNITTLYSAILKSYPSIMIQDVDSWVMIILTHLLEMLRDTDHEIRSCAANTIATFCMKASDSGLPTDIIMRIMGEVRTMLESDLKAASSSSLSSTPTNELGAMSGHLLALSSFGNHGRIESHLQLSITASLMACAKRTGQSILFRSHSMYALAVLLRQLPLGTSAADREALKAQVDAACSIAELQVMSICLNESIGSMDVLFKSILRLVSVCLSIALQLKNSKSIVGRLTTVWQMVKMTSKSVDVTYETLGFIHALTTHPKSELSDIKNLYDSSRDYLVQVLRRRAHDRKTCLERALDCIRGAGITDLAFLENSVIEVEMVKVINWLSTSSLTSVVSPFWNIGISSRLLDKLGNFSTLCKEFSTELVNLNISKVSKSPDNIIVHNIIRADRLLLGTVGEAPLLDETKDDTTKTEGDIGEEEEALEANIMTSHQYVLWRKESIARMMNLSCNLKTKLVVIKCAIESVRFCRRNRSHLDMCHYDVEAAITSTTENLKSLKKGSPPDNVPCYTALFLEDVLKLACSCGTFTIDDKHPQQLQIAGVELMEEIVNVYADSAPKSNRAGDIFRTNISQIVAALRPCLEVKWQPQILMSVGNVAFMLINMGYLEDTLVVKRLTKAIVNASLCDNPQFALRIKSSDAADVVVAETCLASALTLARLYKLAVKTTGSWYLHEDIRRVILEFYPSEMLSDISTLWKSILIDAARFMQDSPYWPRVNKVSDPRRGGLTYSPALSINRIKRCLNQALPIILSTSSSFANESTSSLIFASSQCWCASQVDEASLKTFLTFNPALDAFSSLANDETLRQIIPIEEWIAVLKFLMFDVIGEQSVSLASLHWIPFVCRIINIVVSLTNDQKNSSSNDDFAKICLKIVLFIIASCVNDKELIMNTEVTSESVWRSVLIVGKGEGLVGMKEFATQMSTKVFFNLLSSISVDSSSILDVILAFSCVFQSSHSVVSDKMQVADDTFQCLVELLGKHEIRNILFRDFIKKQKEILSIGSTSLLNAFTDSIFMVTCTDREDVQYTCPDEILLSVLSPSDNNLARSMLSSATRTIQSDPLSRGKIVASLFFPIALIKISKHPKQSDSNTILVALIQFLLAVYGVVKVENKGDYIFGLIPAMSTGLLIHEQVTDFALYCGKAMTHFASLHGLEVKECITHLPEDQRLCLQRVMKAAIENQQGLGPNTTLGAGLPSPPPTAGLKKIDISKYKK
jgi:hypothetical protein